MTSLRARFMLSILLWVGLGIAAIWYSSVRLFTTHVEAQYHEELEVHVRELGELTRLDRAGRPYLIRPVSDPRYGVPLSGYYWQVTRPGFGSITSPSMTRGALDYDIAHSPHILHRVENGPTGDAIVYGFIRQAAPGTPLHFVMATDERHMLRNIRLFTRELTLWLGLLAAALLASGMAIITLGLRPFRRLGAAVDALRNGRAARVDGDWPDEIAPLVQDLNAYAARNAQIVARGRVAAGALAHSLRTPLAIMVDEAERLAEGTAPEAARTLLDESERMLRQIDYHLARARSGGSRVGVAPLADPGTVLAPLVAAMGRCHPACAFVVLAPPGGFAPVAMDGDDLSEILSNLLDNAGKWARGRVTVSERRAGGAHALIVADDGPGLPPDRHEAMFAVGATGDTGGRSGSGLGLAIARDLARDYGHDLLMEPAPGGGLQLVLHFAEGNALDV
ncbi:sensor histidine kinase [Novosphingobium sp. FSY-8]|uniref:histidine kinase n=1 Tax=Novosphingobium ovatum TaxID=1908523 RepID=A0ABW9XFR3_9SPHN|nr:HAMP domain-containing sensor histidine kinase [Novosphingobium ovatum]NBC37395.1 sensor histidine kinase [Novosphingobium ovatum]